MKIEKTPLDGCLIIQNTYFKDERGFFFESFNAQKFKDQTGVVANFVQDNQSRSLKGTLRGLHFQTGEHAQAKLVRVLKGEVLDVAVDIRQSSATFGQHFSVVLSDSSGTQLFIPRGFAHGFLVLSNEADFFYKCDNYYNKSAEGGILYNDKQLQIDWKMPEESLILSEKDKELPSINSIRNTF